MRIARLLLADTEAKLAAKKITLEIDNAALRQLVQSCADEKNGARPLRRAIVRMIENPLSDYMLNGQLSSGEHVRIYADKGNIRFATGEFAI